MMQHSTCAPALMIESCMMIESLTKASFSTTTPGDSTEFSTLPMIKQSGETREFTMWARASIFDGGRSY